MTDYYVDNNKTIYVTEKSFGGLYPAGSKQDVTVGIPDIPILTAQSTVFVNSIRFESVTTVQSGGVGEAYGWTLAGIMPRALATGAGAGSLTDYLEIKGWPLKNSKRFWMCYAGDTGNSANTFRTVYTWKPKEALLINRDQSIYFSNKNHHGNSVQTLLSIVAQLKRGD